MLTYELISHFTTTIMLAFLPLYLLRLVEDSSKNFSLPQFPRGRAISSLNVLYYFVNSTNSLPFNHLLMGFPIFQECALEWNL